MQDYPVCPRCKGQVGHASGWERVTKAKIVTFKQVYCINCGWNEVESEVKYIGKQGNQNKSK